MTPNNEAELEQELDNLFDRRLPRASLKEQLLSLFRQYKGKQEVSKVVFTNEAPEDKEWTAHINILNEWTNPSRYLREIIQYARSGPFYPADMHVNLIRQVMATPSPSRETPSPVEINSSPVPSGPLQAVGDFAKPQDSGDESPRLAKLRELVGAHKKDIELAGIVMDIQLRAFEEAKKPDPSVFVDEGALASIQAYADRQTDERLKLIKKQLHKLNAGIIAVDFNLNKPYPDDPRWTPYSRFVGPRLKMLSAAVFQGVEMGELEAMAALTQGKGSPDEKPDA
jgi:hypothetical protein